MDYDHHHRLLHPTSYCSKEAFFTRMSLYKLILEELCSAWQSETKGENRAQRFFWWLVRLCLHVEHQVGQAEDSGRYSHEQDSRDGVVWSFRTALV
jgi:hypothetical protein